MCVSAPLSLCICARTGLYCIEHSHPSLLRDRLTAWTCHCVRQTQWQPFCKTLFRDSFILFLSCSLNQACGEEFLKVDKGLRVVFNVYSDVILFIIKCHSNCNAFAKNVLE